MFGVTLLNMCSPRFPEDSGPSSGWRGRGQGGWNQRRGGRFRDRLLVLSLFLHTWQEQGLSMVLVAGYCVLCWCASCSRHALNSVCVSSLALKHACQLDSLTANSAHSQLPALTHLELNC